MPSHVALAGGTSSSSEGGGDVPTLGASGGAHQAGIAPDPGATAGTRKVLRENATWGLVLDFEGSGDGHAAGAVPDPGASAGSSRFLNENGAWLEPPGGSDFGPSGDDHSGGAVPDPGEDAGTTHFLCEDATWAVPAGGASTGYVDAAVSALGAAATAAFAVKSNNLSDLTDAPTARTSLGLAAIAASGSGADLSTGTVPAARLPAFVASGSSHAKGAVPDPPATAGTAKFLREDATWAAPPGGGSAGVQSTSDPATFTGLTGDDPKLIRYDIDYCYTETGNGMPRLRINGDTASHYSTQLIATTFANGGPLTSGLAIDAATQFSLGYENQPSGKVIGHIEITFPQSGNGKRMILFNSHAHETTGGGQNHLVGGGVWSNSANEITSISLYFVNSPPDTVRVALTPVYSA